MLYRWLIDERTTVRQILKRLAEGPWRPRNGKRLWSNAVVHRILSDPLYTGTAYANRNILVAPRKPRSTGPRAGLPSCRQRRPRDEWIPIPVPAIIDEITHQHALDQLARNSALSFRNNTRNDYLLRCLLTCRTCGLSMFGVTTSGAGGRRVHRYYMCHGKDTLARDRACRCPQPRAKAEELDAAVWGHVKGLLEDPATLAAQFEERARQADALDADALAAGRKSEAQLRRLDREEQRLIDAYQAEVIDLDELKRRREQIGVRRQMLTLQREQEQRLRCECQTAKDVWADLTAFCERVRSRLDEAALAERQRILQLLIDRVIVGEDALEIRHVIPLGRLKAEPANSDPTDPDGSGGGGGSEPEGTPSVGPGARLRSDGVEMTELVRDAGQGPGDRLADAVLAIGDHSGDRHRQGLPDLIDQAGQVLGRGRQQAPGQEDLPGEAVAQDPEDFVADIGLHPIDGQDDATLVAQQRSQPLGVGRGQGPELVVAVQEVGDRALSDDQTAAGQLAMDLGDATVLGMAEATDQGQDIEPEFVIGQGEMGLGLGAVGAEEVGAIGIGTASDGQGQVEDAIEGGDSAEVSVAGPKSVLTFRAVESGGDQTQATIGLRARSSSFAHRGPPLVATPFLRSRPQLSLPA